MKLKSLKSVLALTAAIGIAFVGVSCKPGPKADGGKEEKGSGAAKEEHADHKGHKDGEKKDAHADHKGEMKKDAAKAGKAVEKAAKDAGKAVEGAAKDASKAVKDAVK